MVRNWECKVTMWVVVKLYPLLQRRTATGCCCCLAPVAAAAGDANVPAAANIGDADSVFGIRRPTLV